MINEALACFREAVDVDPSFALAHAGVTDSNTMLGWYGLTPPWEAMPRAEQAAQRSLELGPGLAEAHAAVACVRLLYNWEWAGADEAFRNALDVNPGYTQARAWHWLFNRLLVQGRFDDALQGLRGTVEIDPLSSYAASCYGFALGIAGLFPDAVKEARRAVELDPTSYLAHFTMSVTDYLSADYESAIASAETALALSGRHCWALAHLTLPLAASGDRAGAAAVHDELAARARREYVQPTMLAISCCALGQTDEAFDALTRAVEYRDPFVVTVKHWPGFGPLRHDPRFTTLLGRIGLS